MVGRCRRVSVVKTSRLDEPVWCLDKTTTSKHPVSRSCSQEMQHSSCDQKQIGGQPSRRLRINPAVTVYLVPINMRCVVALKMRGGACRHTICLYIYPRHNVCSSKSMPALHLNGGIQVNVPICQRLQSNDTRSLHSHPITRTCCLATAAQHAFILCFYIRYTICLAKRSSHPHLSTLLSSHIGVQLSFVPVLFPGCVCTRCSSAVSMFLFCAACSFLVLNCHGFPLYRICIFFSCTLTFSLVSACG